MATFDSIFSTANVESNNKVGTIESMLSGVASGLIAIPKGFFLWVPVLWTWESTVVKLQQ